MSWGNMYPTPFFEIPPLPRNVFAGIFQNGDPDGMNLNQVLLG